MNSLSGICLRVLLLGTLAIGLASCSRGDPDPAGNLPSVGLVQTVKAFGEHFRSTVLGVDEGVVYWETRWKERVISKRKLYLNLFYVAGLEQEKKYVNEFDHAQIDSLFPLEAGNEVSFEGLQRWSNREGALPFWAHVLVRKEDSVEIKGVKHPVFIIDVSMEIDRPEGVQRIITTLWHSPESGLNIKSRSIYDDETFWSHTVGIEAPEDMDRQNNVGTTLIHHQQKDVEAGFVKVAAR